MLTPKSKLSTIASTGIRVPSRTGAPLCTPGLTSTSGHSDQSIFSFVATDRPPTPMIPLSCTQGQLLQSLVGSRLRLCPNLRPGGGWEPDVSPFPVDPTESSDNPRNRSVQAARSRGAP